MNSNTSWRSVARAAVAASALAGIVTTVGTASAAAPAASATTPDGLTAYPACVAGGPINSDAAHGAYIAGKGSFDVGDYGTALAYFKDAYTRDCTKNELLVIIARAYELLPEKSVHNKKETLHALETYVERAPKADDVPRQKQRIERLKEDIAAQETQEKKAAAAAESSASSASTGPGPAQAQDSSQVREHTAAPWVLAGGGAVVAVTGVIVYVVGAGKISDASNGCPIVAGMHSCDATHSSNVSEGTTGNTLEGVGGVMMGVGGAAIVGGLLWHFLEPTGPAKDSAAAPATASFRFDPLVRPGFAGMGAVGTF